MKISYTWLKEHLQPIPSINDLTETLTHTGLEVEDVYEFCSITGGLDKVVVGHVMEVRPHPNANRLRSARVDVGKGDWIPIVCGAPNLAQGQKVLVALPGALLYPFQSSKPLEIKAAKIRGEVSEGMICSAHELGLSSDHAGIMVLPQDAATGTEAAEYFNLTKDVVIEIGITPNRTDALSHRGVARDIFAADYASQKLNLVPKTYDFNFPSLPAPTIELDAPDLCTRYSAICLTDVKVSESPDWLKQKLLSIGLKPINNVVDIANYVMHDMGQPLHAFNLDAFNVGPVVVRLAKTGEKLITLDGQERLLKNNDLLIANGQAPVCLAGVLGGLHSGTDFSTTSILLESACFQAAAVRQTSKNHQLKTDASFRFERGTDPNATLEALKLACYWLEKLAGARICSGLADIYPNPIPGYTVSVEKSYIKKLIGIDIGSKTVFEILSRLDIQVLQNTETELLLQIPTYRTDVRRPADVVEELLRIYGFNKVPVPAKVVLNTSHSNEDVLWRNRYEQSIFLSGLGFKEVWNNSLSASQSFPEVAQSAKLEITNPLSSELNILRPSLLPGLLENARYNRNRQQEVIKLMEWGKTYKVEQKSVVETEAVALLVCPPALPVNHQGIQISAIDYLKGTLMQWFQSLGLHCRLEGPQPNGGFSLHCQQTLIGHGGLVDNGLTHRFDLNPSTSYALVDWKKLNALLATRIIKFKELPKFPVVVRDLALLIDRSVCYATIDNLVRGADMERVVDVSVFDVYEGEKLPSGKKSYAISVSLRDTAKTLGEADIESIMKKILKNLMQEAGASLR